MWIHSETQTTVVPFGEGLIECFVILKKTVCIQAGIPTLKINYCQEIMA